MARYSVLVPQQIEYLAGLYDLKIDSYRPMEGGAANSSFLIQAQDGKYVLTVYEDKTMDEVAAMGRILWELEKHRFPTVVVVPTAKGDVGIELEGKPLLVKKFIPGRVEEKLDEAMLFQIGVSMAQLHQIPAPGYSSRQHPYGPEMISQFIGLDLDAEFDSWLSERRDFIEENYPDDLPRALIHGDLFYDNVLFQDGKLKAIIDFEEVCHYFGVFDVGMALVGLYAQDGKFDLSDAHALVAGYLNQGRLDESEKNALQLMVESAAVATSCWRYWKYNYHDPTPERATKHWEMAAFADRVRRIDQERFVEEVFGG